MSIQDLLSDLISFRNAEISLDEIQTRIASFKSSSKSKKIKAAKYNAQVKWCMVKAGINPKEFELKSKTTK